VAFGLRVVVVRREVVLVGLLVVVRLDVVLVRLLVVVRLDVVLVVLRVDVRVSVRSVRVDVSGTGVVGKTPTVISAEPRPCCPSIPMTM